VPQAEPDQGLREMLERENRGLKQGKKTLRKVFAFPYERSSIADRVMVSLIDARRTSCRGLPICVKVLLALSTHYIRKPRDGDPGRLSPPGRIVIRR
jgi:hypothetical protein